MRQPQVTIFTKSYDGNSIGRAYSVWLSAIAAGYAPRVVVPSLEGSIWSPLEHADDFRASLLSWAEIEDRPPAGTYVAIKVAHNSLGVALAHARTTGAAVIADVDDLDWEGRWGLTYTEQFQSFVAHAVQQRRPPWRTYRLRHGRLRGLNTLTSNPALQRLYGGGLLPHARIPNDDNPPPPVGTDRVAFIGTPRLHKGVDRLRIAAQNAGYRLTVTAECPDSPGPNEEWVGPTSLDEGLRLLRRSTVAAMPSQRTRYAEHQLPVKLMDAMLGSRPVLATDLEPIRWASGAMQCWSLNPQSSISPAG